MRNAFSGYSYQKHVTFLLLSIMDVERNISKIEIESQTTDNFDDLVVMIDSKVFQFQIKDFDNISLYDLKNNKDEIYIKGKKHRLSPKTNIIIFREINLTPEERFLGFPSYKLSEDIIILSLSRVEIDQKLNSLYGLNPNRKSEIDAFFNSILDKRIWSISKEMLPHLKEFLTELQEESVYLSHQILDFESLLLIEGKPGIGKSHFVNTISEEYPDRILYRFWIGNQDRDYKERLIFKNFIRDLSIKLFQDQINRNVDEILSQLEIEGKVFIIDGLDHVENYNFSELENFIDFIEKGKDYCKIIVLSRPLVRILNWETHKLENWNLKQTEKVLERLFHLSDYSIINKIYIISKGYPIIVKYLAEHFKLHNKIPHIDQIQNIDSYYQEIIANETGKQSLSLFLCSNSYLMKSEIELFIGEEKFYVEEFIDEHPYLFDIKLNRISLFHDSFNTFLRKHVDFSHKKARIERKVCKSILNLEKKFLSRLSLFQLTSEQKKLIIVKYASMQTFQKVLEDSVDFEAIASFYNQLREILKEISWNDMNVNEYYDLSLILNLVGRDHLSTLNTFYFTYTRSLIDNGVTDEDITSSEYLFGMYYYVKTKNATLLYNITANNHYDTENFYKDLENDVSSEENHIKKHTIQLKEKAIKRGLNDNFNFNKNLIFIIENIFFHKTNIVAYEPLKLCIEEYIKGNRNKAVYLLEKFLHKNRFNATHPDWILKEVLGNLISYGFKIDSKKNENYANTLEQLISNKNHLGSFDLRDRIHDYIRLALLENRKIDINSIYPFWVKYHQRKDYTLYGIPIALRTLHSEGLITLKNSIMLIESIQEVSEKGYRHLLAEMIELYPAQEIIPYLENEFDSERFQIAWLKLPTAYIDEISERTYNISENRLIEYHRSSSISLEEIENVLYSNKFEKLESTLSFFRIKIRYKEYQEKIIRDFKNSNLTFIKEEKQNNYTKSSSEQRYENGILSFDDINFIKNQKLKPHEIAKYSDGNYTSLPDINIFEIYEQEDIKRNFQKILYNSLTHQSKTINYFHYIYYHPGNVLAMIRKYGNDMQFTIAAENLEKFIKLSLIDFELN